MRKARAPAPRSDRSAAIGLVDDLVLGLDAAELMAAVGLEPDPWQAQLLRSRRPEILVNCSRQSGKTITTAVKVYHAAATTPNFLALIVSASLRQSGEMFSKIKWVHALAPWELRAVRMTQLQMELENGSRIISLPAVGETVRGYSAVNLVVFDEAAWIADPLYFALRPMLAVSRGRLIALSSPFGKTGWFYNEWVSGGDDWLRFEVPATDIPRIPPEFLARELQRMGRWWYEQEYMCKFLDVVDSFFDADAIRRAMSHEVAPLFSTPDAISPPAILHPSVRPLFDVDQT